jgi:pheromone shutdown protein TraB
MSSTLLRIAREHNSVVAVVGKGHLQGINKHWKQPVVVGESFLSKFYNWNLSLPSILTI